MRYSISLVGILIGTMINFIGCTAGLNNKQSNLSQEQIELLHNKPEYKMSLAEVQHISDTSCTKDAIDYGRAMKKEVVNSRVQGLTKTYDTTILGKTSPIYTGECIMKYNNDKTRTYHFKITPYLCNLEKKNKNKRVLLNGHLTINGENINKGCFSSNMSHFIDDISSTLKASFF